MSQAVKVVHFPDTLGASEVMRLRPRLTRLFNGHPRLVFFDMKATRSVQWAGLGMLVDRVKQVGNGHSQVRFSNASPAVSRILTRAGMEELLAPTGSC